jgi:RNA polymerase sigma-70 factor (ECF subfamily)
MLLIETNSIRSSPASLSIFQRLARKDRTAVKDCVDSYGNLIWALAVKFTASSDEAEAAAQEIFIDIWRYAERAENEPLTDETVLVALIARRRLIKFLH